MLDHFTKLVIHLIVTLMLFCVGFLIGGLLGYMLAIMCGSDSDWFPAVGSIIVSGLFVTVYLSITEGNNEG